MAIWDDVLTERDKQVFRLGGYGQKREFGKNPALLIIDINYNFIGYESLPILESVKKYRNSCGEEGWAAVRKLVGLLAIARQEGTPVFYTTLPLSNSWDLSSRTLKNRRSDEDDLEERLKGNCIIKEIAPEKGDVVLEKTGPSAFFATTLLSHLIDKNIDTIIITGCTTSGCVRASAVDAFSYNYNVKIIEECVFDRGQTSHKVSLFDIDAKYGDVVSLEEVQKYLVSLQEMRE